MRRFLLLLCVLLSTHLSASDSFSRIYVFGDSLSDTGNIASLLGPLPNPPFFNNRISNGAVSVEVLAAGVGLIVDASLHLTGPALGTNYAVAGARAGGSVAIDLPTQVNLFLANHGGVAPADALYIVFIGGNDVRDARDATDPVVAAGLIDAAVAAEVSQVNALIVSGAENVLVVNVPDIGSIPESGLLELLTGDDTVSGRATGLTKRYNKSLKRQLKALKKITKADIDIFNLFEEFADIIEDGPENGFTNTSDACFSSVSLSFNAGCGFGANFPQYIFFDEIHPTARVHAMIGQALLDEISEDDDDDSENKDHDDENEDDD